jgi:hypothetical protein
MRVLKQVLPTYAYPIFCNNFSRNTGIYIFLALQYFHETGSPLSGVGDRSCFWLSCVCRLLFLLPKTFIILLSNLLMKVVLKLSVFQLDFEVFRTIASFIKISPRHSLIIKLIFIKFIRTI